MDEMVIEVRPDERFDEAKLQDYLRGALPGSDGNLHVRQFGGGHANLTYLLTFTDHGETTEYVLRRPPLGPVAPGSHDMRREHRVLSRLWASFPLAPRAHLFCPDESVIGAPFFVMERRRGIVVRNEVPDEFGGGSDSVANRKLSEMIIDTLTDFHNVRPSSCGLDDLGRPDGFLRRQVDGWAERWHGAKLDDDARADELIGWLDRELPESPTATLLHNDWRLDNMAVSEHDPGRCVAVFDWDMATQGDPLCDLGTLLAVWYDADEIPASLNPMPTTVPGFLTREEAAHRYAERRGIDPAITDYYVVFGSFKMAVILQQIFIRYHRGQTQDARFGAMGEAAGHLLQLALDRRNA